MALATSSVESLPPSPQPVRREVGRVCVVVANGHVFVGADFAFGDDARDRSFKARANSVSLRQAPIEMLDRSQVDLAARL